MDFAIFAGAFNLGKLHNKAKNASKKQKNTSCEAKIQGIFVFILIAGKQKTKIEQNYKAAA
jgi:hypothetical protein